MKQGRDEMSDAGDVAVQRVAFRPRRHLRSGPPQSSVVPLPAKTIPVLLAPTYTTGTTC
jgi:hypothetical protein